MSGKFCNKNCEVNITASYQKDGSIMVCIKDNGIGIQKDVLEKLSNEENISTRGTLNEKGTGLGLIVCKEFMKKNDGILEITSEEGKGAKFCIQIPTKNKDEVLN